MVKIEWANHASYITEVDGVRIITDPWLDGRVFNESWSLLSPTSEKHINLDNIDFIWFSHEHPDHFFPPFLKRIPAANRAKITVLYHETIDKKVKTYCENAGFKKVIEMKAWDKVKITENVSLICATVVNDRDSWLVLKYKDFTLVNLNDCVIRTHEELAPIRKVAGDKIDILLTQFSYAAFAGNRGDEIEMRKSAQDSINKMTMQIEYLQPKYVIPFASYVWFCHRDNFYLNACANRLEDVYRLISEHLKTPCTVLYNGETWEYGAPHDSMASMHKYQIDGEKVNESNVTIPAEINPAMLKTACDAFVKRALELNNKKKLLTYAPLSVYVTDLQKSFALSYKAGLQEINKHEDSCDVAMCSQSLKYCLDFLWGFETITIAGTYQKPKGGNFQNYLEYEWISNLNNTGKRMGGLLERGLTRLKQLVS